MISMPFQKIAKDFLLNGEIEHYGCTAIFKNGGSEKELQNCRV
jgi:hypothetical protein